ncbi:hypothetical protein [Staphylococcus kloosii]|uniref:Uncharacterized protein n=1 Tax=Staphylococcus kloosii TaxID=29384 RepID=A0A151A6P3_9STAP|nr:hypothetical protein [Staphylococcus kloosii]KYH14905.1 hypothetical protein A0131_08965 [Staphylococcus kloosii]
MIFKGEEISIQELARKTGISYGTLEYRYNHLGLRDDDLLNGKAYKKSATLTYNAETFTVSEEDKRSFYKKGISVKVVQKRLDAGWDYDLATNLNKSYVTVDNKICFELKVKKHFYHIPYDELDDLEEDHITMPHIRSGLTAGNDIYEIVPTGTVVYINGVKHTGDPDVFDEMEDEYIEKKVQAYKTERHREKKAHLYKVPQQHSESKYAKYLWESYTFKCKEVTK